MRRAHAPQTHPARSLTQPFLDHPSEHFAAEANAKIGGGVDVRKSPKSMAKLVKQCKRTKEILSANAESPLSVEAMHGEVDFRSSITRGAFLCVCVGWVGRSVLCRSVCLCACVLVCVVHWVGVTRTFKSNAEALFERGVETQTSFLKPTRPRDHTPRHAMPRMRMILRQS